MDVNTELVALLQSHQAVKAAVEVLQVAREIDQTLIHAGRHQLKIAIAAHPLRSIS